jgi:hypothetical protein
MSVSSSTSLTGMPVGAYEGKVEGFVDGAPVIGVGTGVGSRMGRPVGREHQTCRQTNARTPPIGTTPLRDLGPGFSCTAGKTRRAGV